ncbi:hypothetical protein ACFLVX_03620 [Chloroflexota bacterium]
MNVADAEVNVDNGEVYVSEASEGELKDMVCLYSYVGLFLTLNYWESEAKSLILDEKDPT